MNEDKNELIRGLTLTDTTALVVGTVIGSGVFLKTAVMTQEVGTPTLVLAAWVAAGLLSLAGALTYAELLVTSSVFVLRRKMPDAPRPYKTVGYPLVPLVFVLVSSWLVVNTFIEKRVESVTGIILILMGLPLYAWFRRKQGAWASP